jgi:hypothetical protein
MWLLVLELGVGMVYVAAGTGTWNFWHWLLVAAGCWKLAVTCLVQKLGGRY